VLGEFGEDSINQVRADLQQRQQRRPRATTFRSGAFLAVDYLRFLLSVDDYDPDSDAEFAHLLRAHARSSSTSRSTVASGLCFATPSGNATRDPHDRAACRGRREVS
jgi:hypothetical protein